MDDLSKVSTLEQLVAFDFVKYINSFNGILNLIDFYFESYIYDDLSYFGRRRNCNN